MSDLIKLLQACTEERRDEILLDKWEYRRATWTIEERWELFKASLSEKQRQQLDDLLSAQSEIQYMEETAAFRAALSAGIELGRI